MPSLPTRQLRTGHQSPPCDGDDSSFTPNAKHVLETQECQRTFRIEFHNSSYSDDDIVDVFTRRLTELFNFYRNVFIPVGLYHWTRHQLTYGTPLNRRFTMRFFERFGSYYNSNLNEGRVR